MRRSTLLSGLLLLLIPLVTAGCGEKKRHTETAAPVVKGAALELARMTDIPDLVEAVGTVKARNSAQIAARIPGTVKSVLVREGERVGRGRLLLTIDAAESMAGAASAQAGVEEGQRALEEALARQSLADVTWQRFNSLYQEQAATRQELDARTAERDMARQGVARARARLIQAREALRAAGAVAGYTKVTAPISGVVTAKSVDVGMTVFPGTPLMIVEETGAFRLEAAAPESLLGKFRVGEAVAVEVTGAPPMNGRVAEVVPSADPLSRTFTVKIDIAGSGLRSGTFGKAAFAAGSHRGILVSRSAVFERGALTAVWAVGTDRIARMRLVRIGKTVGDKVEVLSGLAEGENVVIAGGEKVVDGARIE
ncbi:MAG: efflux RND transporter periplasmic adaptor subunit [Geobacter sp.]|nr:efflux RND transporter periplasmic adaptor subunit [Geobacter sp.]